MAWPKFLIFNGAQRFSTAKMAIYHIWRFGDVAHYTCVAGELELESPESHMWHMSPGQHHITTTTQNKIVDARGLLIALRAPVGCRMATPKPRTLKGVQNDEKCHVLQLCVRLIRLSTSKEPAYPS